MALGAYQQHGATKKITVPNFVATTLLLKMRFREKSEFSEGVSALRATIAHAHNVTLR